MKFTYQHTCRKDQSAYILNRSPFQSITKKNAHEKVLKYPFLGSGFYFWEENVLAAKRWGEIHYKNNYSIVECIDVSLDDELLLNFLDRRSLDYFNELKEIYETKNQSSKKWKIGQWIEFFKKLNRIQDGKFPYKYIRAIEILPDTPENNAFLGKTRFTESSNIETFTSPLIILCIIDRKDLVFKSKHLISA